MDEGDCLATSHVQRSILKVFTIVVRHGLFRVGIELPTIEVRYENLTIEADCYVGDRALPTLLNSTRNIFEV